MASDYPKPTRQYSATALDRDIDYYPRRQLDRCPGAQARLEEARHEALKEAIMSDGGALQKGSIAASNQSGPNQSFEVKAAGGGTAALPSMQTGFSAVTLAVSRRKMLHPAEILRLSTQQKARTCAPGLLIGTSSTDTRSRSVYSPDRLHYAVLWPQLLPPSWGHNVRAAASGKSVEVGAACYWQGRARAIVT